MSELVRWLAAILDEDERVARAAQAGGDGRWSLDDSGGEPELRGHDDHGNWLVLLDAHSPSWEQAQHVIRHDPAAVLADIAAKRAILDQHRFYLGGGAREQLCQTCGGEGVMNVVSWPCNTIRLLASAYAHRDGFDPAWAVLDEVELW